jgi:hypothetical protein
MDGKALLLLMDWVVDSIHHDMPLSFPAGWVQQQQHAMNWNCFIFG